MQINRTRRSALAACAQAAFLCALATTTHLSFAQSAWPNKQVRIVVPFAAGGGVDVTARILAQGLTERFGQTVFVENRTGASGIIYGTFLVFSGLLLVGEPAAFQRLFPGPILGTLLLVEAITVLLLVRDLRDTPGWLAFAVACGLGAAFLPYGYAVALLGGTLVAVAVRRWTRQTAAI